MDADRLRPVPADPDGSAGTTPETLLTQVARGDAGAFEQLYPTIAGPVYGLARRVLRNPALAEEVSQEVLVDVWRLAPRFDATKGSAMSWVLTMAHRRAVDRVRREQSHTERTARAAALAAADVESVAEQAERSWEAARVRRVLSVLSPPQSEAIRLAFFDGHTHQEVSGILGVPLGTAKTRIRDGLIRLRDALEAER